VVRSTTSVHPCPGRAGTGAGSAVRPAPAHGPCAVGPGRHEPAAVLRAPRGLAWAPAPYFRDRPHPL